jgi:oligopeptide transport system substrate-binding protein
VIGLGLGLGLGLGCGGNDLGPRGAGASAGPPRRGGTLRWATLQQVRTLDPHVGNDEISIYIIHDVYDTLVGYEPADPARKGSGLKLVPHLASGWTVSPDHLLYVFTLRDGITYADGTPIRAIDFKTSLERALSYNKSAFASYLVDVVGAPALTEGTASSCEGIRVIDDHHLEIRLSRPYAGFLYVMAMTFATPIPAAHLKAAGDQLRREPLASGPWQIVRWDEGQSIELERNPRYWDTGKPYLDRQVLLENIPSDTAYLMFEQGEIDTVDRLPSPVYVWIQGRPEWKPYIHDSGAMNVYGERMNVRVKPFDDVRVRRALNYAVNKEHIVRLLGGGASVSHGLLPPGMFGRDAGLAPYPHDPARARALLAEAGYPDGFEVEYVTTKGDDAEKAALSMQADLAEVGVKVKIRVMSFAAYLSETGSAKGAPFSIGSWIEDYPDPSDFVDVKFATASISDENSNNDCFYSNPKLDAMMTAARYDTDEAQRALMYQEIEQLLYAEAPWIWEYHRHFLEVTQPYVHGYDPHPVWLRDYTDTWVTR